MLAVRLHPAQLSATLTFESEKCSKVSRCRSLPQEQLSKDTVAVDWVRTVRYAVDCGPWSLLASVKVRFASKQRQNAG